MIEFNIKDSHESFKPSLFCTVNAVNEFINPNLKNISRNTVFISLDKSAAFA